MSDTKKYYIHVFKHPGMRKYYVNVNYNYGKATDTMRRIEGPYEYTSREPMTQRVFELGTLYRRKGPVEIVYDK